MIDIEEDVSFNCNSSFNSTLDSFCSWLDEDENYIS